MTLERVCRACVHCRVSAREIDDVCLLTGELCENRRAQKEEEGGCDEAAEDFRPVLALVVKSASL